MVVNRHKIRHPLHKWVFYFFFKFYVVFKTMYCNICKYVL